MEELKVYLFFQAITHTMIICGWIAYKLIGWAFGLLLKT